MPEKTMYRIAQPGMKTRLREMGNGTIILDNGPGTEGIAFRNGWQDLYQLARWIDGLTPHRVVAQMQPNGRQKGGV